MPLIIQLFLFSTFPFAFFLVYVYILSCCKINLLAPHEVLGFDLKYEYIERHLKKVLLCVKEPYCGHLVVNKILLSQEHVPGALG